MMSEEEVVAFGIIAEAAAAAEKFRYRSWLRQSGLIARWRKESSGLRSIARRWRGKASRVLSRRSLRRKAAFGMTS